MRNRKEKGAPKVEKKKVYVETSVISNLTARPSNNLIDAARQAQTIAWWTDAPMRFEL